MNLHLDTILEYIDSPQLFVARDDFDTMYLCLAYDQDKYTAIRISANRMREFEKREKDLRCLYLNPENSNEYFDVEGDQYGNLKAYPLDKIEEFRLPEEGFFLTEPLIEKITVTIPSKDKPLFSSIAKRFGWIAAL